MKQMSEKRRRRIEKILYRDRRGKVIIYNRIFVMGLAMLLQIALVSVLLVKVFYTNSQNAVLTFLATNVVAFLLLLHIINNNDKLSGKFGWVIIILLMPVFGILMFFLYGDGRPTKKMNMKINAEKQKNYAALPAAKCIPGTPPMLSALSASQFLRTPKEKKVEQTDDTPREFADETENAKPCGITKYLSDFAGFPVSYDGEATYFSSGKETLAIRSP